MTPSNLKQKLYKKAVLLELLTFCVSIKKQTGSDFIAKEPIFSTKRLLQNIGGVFGITNRNCGR